jgi:hypothetical protein
MDYSDFSSRPSSPHKKAKTDNKTKAISLKLGSSLTPVAGGGLQLAQGYSFACSKLPINFVITHSENINHKFTVRVTLKLVIHP